MYNIDKNIFLSFHILDDLPGKRDSSERATRMKFLANLKKTIEFSYFLRYNVDRHYISAGSRPTQGRTNPKANRVQPPGETCPEGMLMNLNIL